MGIKNSIHSSLITWQTVRGRLQRNKETVTKVRSLVLRRLRKRTSLVAVKLTRCVPAMIMNLKQKGNRLGGKVVGNRVAANESAISDILRTSCIYGADKWDT